MGAILSMASCKTISILGATGSIGDATLDIVRSERQRLGEGAARILALSAGSNWSKLAALAKELQPEFVAIADSQHEADLRDALAGTGIRIGIGAEAVVEAAEMPAQWVMAAISGAAGLPPVLAAAKRGCTLAIANKEALICAGSLLAGTARAGGTEILPVDSEHNAIFQVLDPEQSDMIERIILTASGGPFRTWDAESIARATPKQAVAHPVWSMGAKISVDSATLMNKGLELVEARHLFDVSPSQLDVLVHPQSIIHGLVEYKDGSMLAQLGSPDMRVPISTCWNWPERTPNDSNRLSLVEVGRLEFEAPDEERFPCLALAKQAMQVGDNACNALSAANEVAVEQFLQGETEFERIPYTVAEVVFGGKADWSGNPQDFNEVYSVDARARQMAKDVLGKLSRRQPANAK